MSPVLQGGDGTGAGVKEATSRPVRFLRLLRLQVWKRESLTARAAGRPGAPKPKEQAMSKSLPVVRRGGSVAQPNAGVPKRGAEGETNRNCGCTPVCLCGSSCNCGR